MTGLIGGAELGGTKCILALAHNPREILHQLVVPTSKPDETFRKIFAFFSKHKLDKIGVGTFGPVVLDPTSDDYGLLISESKKGWCGVNIHDEFTTNLNAQISIDTDVNVAAIGEYVHGAGQGSKTLIYVTVGTGIGGGLIIDGGIYRGCFHLEIGHMRIPNPDNFEGVCQIHGDCWEGLASGPAIHKKHGISPADLSDSHPAWDSEVDLLAYGLVSLIANYSPDKVVLGGGVMNRKHLYPRIRSKVMELWNNYTPLGDLSEIIVEPKLGSDSGIVGALVMSGGPAQI